MAFRRDLWSQRSATGAARLWQRRGRGCQNCCGGLRRRAPASTSLVGPDPDRPGGLLVYIGEADDVAARLRIHLRSETKDFFDRLLIVVSSADNLTKAHVRYIESQLIRMAQQAGSVRLTNDTHPASGPLEWKVSTTGQTYRDWRAARLGQP